MTERIMAAWSPGQKRDPDGQWSDGIPGPAGDPLKLAGRIRLGPGETFGGSARIHDSAGDQSVVMARIDGPGGSRLRFGVVNPDDTKAWRAENKGRTVELDAAGARELRDAVSKAAADGRQNVSDFRGELRQAHKQDRPADQWPGPEADIASGVVRGSAWGDVNWKLTREEGDDYSPGGADLGPGGSWSLAIDPAPDGADERREPFYIDSASAAGKFTKAITNLMGAEPVTASLERTHGGDMAELLGVELARPGTWHLSSGPREFTAAMLRDAADFYAASGSQQIPLGFGHQDRRFDGDPAFGWLSNVRYDEDDDGPVLLGDLVELDEWVAAAAPARWPHRSIEGVAGVTFKGREYALALTRLALLGSTPPGIPVLKSLSDLRQLVSAAAAESGAEWIAASTEATPAGVEPPSPTEGAGMYLAKYREVLAGLPDGASDDEVTAAIAAAGLVASQPEPKPAPNPTRAAVPAPTPEPEPQLVSASSVTTPGTVLIASSVWEETQNTIKRLAAHVDQAKRDEADKVIASAVEQGKFTPAQKPHFAKLWLADPEGTKALIEGLTPNSALAIAASGYADLDDKEFDREYAGLFPPGSMTKGA